MWRFRSEGRFCRTKTKDEGVGRIEGVKGVGRKRKKLRCVRTRVEITTEDGKRTTTKTG